MSDELKACPFCGKSDIHIEQKGTFFWCECYDCGAISREHHTLPSVNVLQSEDFARGYWNQRPIEDALEKRIARAKELLDAEMLPYNCTRTIDLPDHYLQLQQVIDVLNGGGE